MFAVSVAVSTGNYENYVQEHTKAKRPANKKISCIDFIKGYTS